MTDNVDKARALTPAEMAAISSQVPCSGNPEIDSIISLGLRYKTALSAFESLIRNQPRGTAENLSKEALEYADIFIRQFTTKE